jgi:hypothetical protein
VTPADQENFGASDLGPLVKIDHDISDPRFRNVCTLCNLREIGRDKALRCAG